MHVDQIDPELLVQQAEIGTATTPRAALDVLIAKINELIGAGRTVRIITYTATGSEGVDFPVPIGLTLDTTDYEVGFFGIAGAANVPVMDFPTGAGDRTTTTFRVLTAAPMTFGDVIKFQLVEN